MANVKVILLTKIVLMLSLAVQTVKAQNTVFTVLTKDKITADRYYADQRYQPALELYLRIDRKQADAQMHPRIARCFYFLRRYDEARRWYDKALTTGTLSQSDTYCYAEALTALKDYRKAAEAYGRYLEKDPGNELIAKKIWRLHNIRFLYEDSAHYALRPVDVNSDYDDMAAVPYGDGLVFMSNRKTVQVVENIDASTNTSFFRLYYSGADIDSLTGLTQGHSTPEIWQKTTQKFHEGPVAFFGNERQMVFTRTAKDPGKDGRRTLQLFFAEKRDGRWKETGAFPFNSDEYSISDPSMSNDGSVLYFSSDMKGGKGGKDLYRSQNLSGKWTKPVNLESINTPYAEVSPYLAANHVLYFSSNGHAGLGGLDIFKVSLNTSGLADIQNPGYPLNTNADEFAIIIDSLNIHGYITSNRSNGGNDDDIYEFDIDLQTYPLTIDGVVKFKEINWTDSAELKVMANAKLSLIDNIRNVPVFECVSDSAGHYHLEIPYFSTYRIKVTGEDAHENIVSLEIPKHRKADSRHEIVVVKDPFKSKPNEVPR